MQSFSIVPSFYIFKYDDRSVLFSDKAFLMYAFGFQCLEKAFSHCVVPAFPFLLIPLIIKGFSSSIIGLTSNIRFF